MASVQLRDVMSWPNDISHRLLVQLICKYFPFQSIGLDSFRKLPSYCDAMYYFTGTLAAQEEFVLKLLNPEDSKDLDLQDGLARLSRYITSKGFICPCPIQSHLGTGSLVVLQRSTLLEYMSTGIMEGLVNSTGAGSDEPRCCVSVYRYIPGKIDGDGVMEHSPQFLYKAGSYVALLDKELMGFTHTSLEERCNLMWSLSMLLMQRERKLKAVKDVERLEVLNKILDDFQNHVLPVMNAPETLKGLIHNDIHPGNTVLTQNSKGEFEINGIIDFWDCLHAPYLFELGIALAGYMVHREDPIVYVKPFLRGYLAVLCLAQSSLDVLYYVVLGRLAQIYMNSVTSVETDPMNEYVLTLVHSSWLLIDKLISSGIDNCYSTWFGLG